MSVLGKSSADFALLVQFRRDHPTGWGWWSNKRSFIENNKMAVEELLATASNLENYFQGQGWRFCFIGGVAVQRWGEPRFTQDIDLTLIAGFGEEEQFVDALLRKLEQLAKTVEQRLRSK